MKKSLSFLVVTLILTGCLPQKQIYTPNEEEKEMIITIQEVYEAFNAYEPSDEEKKKVVLLSENGSVYYFAADGKRYIFPTTETYESWFGVYEIERVMDLEEMQKIPLGGNVTLRPGTLLQTPSDPKIYLVTDAMNIAVVDERVLVLVYGEHYQARVVELPNYYFTNYSYVLPILSLDQFPVFDTQLTIDKNKGFE